MNGQRRVLERWDLEDGVVSKLWVRFLDSKAGYSRKTSEDSAVPIEPTNVQFDHKGGKVTRIGFALTGGAAVSIHKTQGLTLDNIVADFNSCFCGSGLRRNVSVENP